MASSVLILVFLAVIGILFVLIKRDKSKEKRLLRNPFIIVIIILVAIVITMDAYEMVMLLWKGGN